MGNRAGGGAGRGMGGSISFSRAGGFSGGLSDSDRADLKMYKNTGSTPAEIKDAVARKKAMNAAGAARVSNVTLTKTNSGYRVSWNTSAGQSSWSLGSETTLAQAKKFANVIKQTGHSGKANYQLTH